MLRRHVLLTASVMERGFTEFIMSLLDIHTEIDIHHYLHSSWGELGDTWAGLDKMSAAS